MSFHSLTAKTVSDTVSCVPRNNWPSAIQCHRTKVNFMFNNSNHKLGPTIINDRRTAGKWLHYEETSWLKASCTQRFWLCSACEGSLVASNVTRLTHDCNSLDPSWQLTSYWYSFISLIFDIQDNSFMICVPFNVLLALPAAVCTVHM